MGPQVGETAPDFKLQGVPPLSGGGHYHLAAQRGKVVVLAFYPGDFSMVCTRQLKHYEEQRQQLEATGVVLWAISTDRLEQHERMAKAYALSFPLLVDADGAVAESYGIKTLMGTARRSIFIIDAKGEIRWRQESPLSLTYVSVEDLAAALRESALVPLPPVGAATP